MNFESPRGPLEIDARNRDIVQTAVASAAPRKRDGKYVNVEVASYPRRDRTR